MKKCYLDLPEGQIHYRIAGEGQPLLLLHQSPMSGVEWDEIIPLLSEHFLVIAPDMVGHGQSYEPVEISMSLLTDITVKLMDALHLDQVYLAGNHSGAALATSIATRYPKRVVKIAISGEMLISKVQIDQFLEAIKDKPLSRDIPLDNEGDFIAQAWKRYQALAPTAPLEKRYKPFIHGQLARLRTFDIHELIMEWMASTNWLKMIECPILVFSAQHDLFFSEALLEQARAELKDCQTVVINDAGALSTFEQPVAVATALKHFFLS